MPRVRPPHLHRERTRHGAYSWYVRQKHGRRIRLRAEYGTAEFWAEYRAALEGSPAPTTRAKARALSLEWAIMRYRTRSAWTQLAQATRKQRENIFRAVIATAGQERLRDVDRDAIRGGRERRAATPHAANNFLKTMRGFFAWAVDDGLVTVNPTIGVKLLKGPNDADGFHTWTEEEVQRFEAQWPIGTRERLAFDLLLYTGLRRGDVVALGRQHVRDGIISIRMEKKTGERKTGQMLTIPMLPILSKTIEASTTGDLAFLVTDQGRPFVKEGFGNWFGDACRAAGCPGTAHGLRKAGATRAAENGASERQLMAIFGWSTSKMATHYTRAAEKKHLAMSATELLLPAQKSNQTRPHLRSGAGTSSKKPKKRGA